VVISFAHHESDVPLARASQLSRVVRASMKSASSPEKFLDARAVRELRTRSLLKKISGNFGDVFLSAK
jgi:hypothetical protein